MRWAAVVIAFALGALAGEGLSRMPAVHRLLGRVLGRGDLVAVVGHRGIFGRDDVGEQVLSVRSASEKLDEAEVERAMFAARGEFGGNRNFDAALRADRMWSWQLRRLIAERFRGERWLEEKIAPASSVSLTEAQRYYAAHQAEFAQPLRIRVRHVFFAAPLGSANTAEKGAAMQELIGRLARGEDFAAVAAALSEDEATKARGGDLGFLAAKRVSPEFWAAIEKLPVNGPPAFVQSHLGFHAGQVLERENPRQMSFAEAQPEIEQALAREKRRSAVSEIRDRLKSEAFLAGR